MSSSPEPPVARFTGILIAYGIVLDAYVAIAMTARLSTEYRIDMAVEAALAINAYDAQRLFICSLLAGTTIGVSVVLTAVLVVSLLDSRGLLPGTDPPDTVTS